MNNTTNQQRHRLVPIPTDVESRGALDMPIQCLMCDIYGTLFISGSGDIGTSKEQSVPQSALADLMARHRITGTPGELMEQMHAVIEASHARSRSAGIDHPEIRIDEIWSQVLQRKDIQMLRRFSREFEMIMNPVWPMPGLERLLEQCRDAGIAMGIVSNAQFFTLPLFKLFLDAEADALGFHPDLTILSYRHGMAKPSADLFQIAVSNLKSMGVSASATAFIGNDMANDMAPARDAGFQTILFAGDARSLRLRADMPQCADFRPDLVVTDLQQVMPYLAHR